MQMVIVGGTNFIGPYVVRQLVDAGHHVTLFHRKISANRFDRTLDDFSCPYARGWKNNNLFYPCERAHARRVENPYHFHPHWPLPIHLARTREAAPPSGARPLRVNPRR